MFASASYPLVKTTLSKLTVSTIATSSVYFATTSPHNVILPKLGTVINNRNTYMLIR